MTLWPISYVNTWYDTLLLLLSILECEESLLAEQAHLLVCPYFGTVVALFFDFILKLLDSILEVIWIVLSFLGIFEEEFPLFVELGLHLLLYADLVLETNNEILSQLLQVIHEHLMSTLPLLVGVVTRIFKFCLFDLQSVWVFLIWEASSLLISLGLSIHVIWAFIVAIIVFFRLFSEGLELVIPVNDEIINQNTIEPNYVALYFAQPLLVNIALESVRVVILLKHFQVPLGQSGRNSLEMGDVLVDLHHQFALFICFQLFVNSGVFGQDLLVHSTSCCGHYGIVISQVQVVYRKRLACRILTIEWIKSLSHGILTLSLGNSLSSTIVLRGARVGGRVVEGVVSALVLDIHLTFHLVHGCPLVNSALLVVLLGSKEFFGRCNPVFWVHVLLTYYSVLRGRVKFLIFQAALWSQIIHLRRSLRAGPFENTVSGRAALDWSLITEYLKLLMCWVV